jgi:hypothetical protein
MRPDHHGDPGDGQCGTTEHGIDHDQAAEQRGGFESDDRPAASVGEPRIVRRGQGVTAGAQDGDKQAGRDDRGSGTNDRRPSTRQSARC